jgi:hypothetical protein
MTLGDEIVASYEIEIRGLDARVTITRGNETASAWGILFDENAEIVTETESTRYSGYCDAEILTAVVGEMAFSRRGIEWDDIHATVEALDLPACECED